MSLVQLTPPDCLVFQLERGNQSKTILKVTNVSPGTIVFKVKTTQPSWYYVRPNQQMLGVGKSEDVEIILVDTECNRYLAQLDEGKEDKPDRHRFLVQSTIISDEETSRIMELPATQRNELLSKVWDGKKDDKRNIKLKVEFITPNSNNNSSAQRRDNQEDGLPQALSSGSSAPTPSIPSSHSSSNSVAASSPEAVFAELQGLRKKYDAVVEYTVSLTQVKDDIVSQLEQTQRDLRRERASNETLMKGGVVKGAGRDSTKNVKVEKKNIEKGFSFLVVLFVALAAFVAGKFLSQSIDPLVSY
jgi:hypothetical protein